MEGDGMDKLERMDSVCEFDPITGNIPATKVEITVSCSGSYNNTVEGFHYIFWQILVSAGVPQLHCSLLAASALTLQV
ncbi:copine-5 isoform X1 [Tachysurus ichikawai]